MAAQSLSRQKITCTQTPAQAVYYLRLANKWSNPRVDCNLFPTKTTGSVTYSVTLVPVILPYVNWRSFML